MTLLYPSMREVNIAGSTICVANTSPLKIPKRRHRAKERECVDVNRLCRTPCEELNFQLDDLTINANTDDESENTKTLEDSSELSEFNAVRSILKKGNDLDDYVGTYFLTSSGCSSLNYDPSPEHKDALTRSQSAKNVTFADDNDLSLVEIRTFGSTPIVDCFQSPDFTNSSFMKSRKGEIPRSLSVGAVPSWRPDLTMHFKEPYSETDFREKLVARQVSLEKCGTRNRLITGLVLVKNIEFNKRVLIRYTLDSWKSVSDAEALYLSSIEDGAFDRFTFTLSLPIRSNVLEFAVCYKTSNMEFWDNNDNKNYRVEDVLQSPA